jgi:hypothetical protein
MDDKRIGRGQVSTIDIGTDLIVEEGACPEAHTGCGVSIYLRTYTRICMHATEDPY